MSNLVDLARYRASLEPPGPPGPQVETRDGVVVLTLGVGQQCELTPAAAQTLAANLMVFADSLESEAEEWP